MKMSDRLRYNKGDDNSSISGEDDIDDIRYKILSSEEEYFENKKRLLENIHYKQELNNYDSENEVMKFSDKENEEEEEKDSLISDIEGLDEEFDLPNEKAWGKKKKAYYSTDYVDADYSYTSQKDIVDADLEEEEARNLQKQLASQLDEADFGLDLVIPKEEIIELDKNNEHIKVDLSKLSKREKQELLEKKSPEFMYLLTDFQDRLMESRTILGPFLDLVDRSNCQNCSAISFIRTKYEMLLHYCTNVSFYLMLKAKKESVASHPVIKRLAQYKQILTQLEDRQGYLLNEIQKILEANEIGKSLHSFIGFREINIKDQTLKIEDSSKKFEIIEKISKRREFEHENYNLDQRILENVHSEDNETKEIETDKRAITYQIAKNKGLTPLRKKEQRNPRVKHRNKYRKAKIRRRGAVREVRKEITRYGGEISGIKASVKKSIKLK